MSSHTLISIVTIYGGLSLVLVVATICALALIGLALPQDRRVFVLAALDRLIKLVTEIFRR